MLADGNSQVLAETTAMPPTQPIPPICGQMGCQDHYCSPGMAL